MVNCKYCGKEFTSRRKNHKYCSKFCIEQNRLKNLTSLKTWADRNKDRSRELMLKRKYGITLLQYEELLAKQNYCCAICNRHHSNFKIKLAVDHSHRTNLIRGLLCTYCNRFFLSNHSDPDKFERAASYLRQNSGWLVPDKKRKRNGKKSRSRKQRTPKPLG